jgi:hypothetical protein
VNVKELGINEEVGGAALVVAGTIVEHRSYKGKDGSMKYPTTVLYFGGNLTLNLEPDHPLKAYGVGEQVLFAQPMLEDRFGWKPTGAPTPIEQTNQLSGDSKPKTKTPSTTA